MRVQGPHFAGPDLPTDALVKTIVTEPAANLQPRAIGGAPSWSTGISSDARIDASRTATGPGGDFDDSSIDRFPAWLAGFLVVAYCAIFWVGVVTVAGWFWRALIG